MQHHKNKTEQPLNDALSIEGRIRRQKTRIVVVKNELQEKITDFEQKWLSWLEPAREFVKSLNQAEKLVQSENKKEMTTFLKNIGSNHVLENRQFVFAPKIQYKLVAEPTEAGEANLTIPRWCAVRDLNWNQVFENIRQWNEILREILPQSALAVFQQRLSVNFLEPTP